jgi:rhomboid protease GluP
MEAYYVMRGGLSVDNIVNDREYYRLFTSLFLHADLNHILSNMLILFYIGEEVEKKIGHFRYAAVLFCFGTCR